MPSLHILAGPNGAGKTTFYSTAVQYGLLKKELSFVNIDSIAQRLGGYTEENYVKASELYRQQMKVFIESENDFMIESNLADNRSYDWLSLLKSKGYDIILYYLSTDDISTNTKRVQRRVAEGGHDIPESIIRSSYAQSHSYLKTKLSLFKKVYLIDNSTDTPQVQIKMIGGTIVEKEAMLLDWVKEAISIHERLQGRKL